MEHLLRDMDMTTAKKYKVQLVMQCADSVSLKDESSDSEETLPGVKNHC